MSIALFWVGTGITFLIIEMITTAFYGLSLAIAAFSVALYTYIMHSTELDWIQGVILIIISLLVSYILPRIFTEKVPRKPQGLDMYIGAIKRIRKVDEDYRMRLDGIEYVVIIEDDSAKTGDRVELIGRKGSIFYAAKV